MPKPPKVVPIAEDKRKVIARDPETQRVIVAMGNHRFAIDFTRRITQLPPHTGDQPAEVLPIRKKRK
jgi:hypothetical protein